MLKDSPELYTAALDVISDDPSLSVLLGDYPLVLGKCAVSEETAKSIFPQELHMTQSRLESFINCKFSDSFLRYCFKKMDKKPFLY